MSSVLQSIGLYGDGEWNELMLMLLDKASVADSMVAIFAHHDNGTAPLFEASSPLDTGQCLV